jgi:hypothetical protein
VKRIFIALCAAALVAAAPAVSAKDASSRTPPPQHKVSKTHHARLSGYAPWQARGSNAYPGAFGYAPARPRDMTDISPQGGGGGGGGGWRGWYVSGGQTGVPPSGRHPGACLFRML